MGRAATASWDAMRTDETRLVERLLREQFPQADAYRHSFATIRVRVIDERFEGLPFERRVDLIEPLLAPLPGETQGDIASLLLLAPSEVNTVTIRGARNVEFEAAKPFDLDA